MADAPVASGTSEPAVTHFEPPTGIWSLVSLLLLLEENERAGEGTYIPRWLQEATGDPALAADTLQMADYMGVTRIVELLSEYCRGIRTSLGVVRRRLGRLCGEVELRGIRDLSQWAMSADDFMALMLWNLPAPFCKDLIHDEMTWQQAHNKHGEVVFSKWLQDAGPLLDLTVDERPNYAGKVLMCLVNCPQVTAQRALGESIFCEVTELDGPFQESAWPVGSLRSLHLDTINLDDQVDGFLALQKPLGSLGEALTSLRFDAIDHQHAHSQSYMLNEDTNRAAESWTFFRAIGRLPRLRKLAVPCASWDDLTASGMEVAAPLQELEGLVVEDSGDGGILAQVDDRRVVLHRCPDSPGSSGGI